MSVLHHHSAGGDVPVHDDTRCDIPSELHTYLERARNLCPAEPLA
jgi:hypothetical protein